MAVPLCNAVRQEADEVLQPLLDKRSSRQWHRQASCHLGCEHVFANAKAVLSKSVAAPTLVVRVQDDAEYHVNLSEIAFQGSFAELLDVFVQDHDMAAQQDRRDPEHEESGLNACLIIHHDSSWSMCYVLNIRLTW